MISMNNVLDNRRTDVNFSTPHVQMNKSHFGRESSEGSSSTQATASTTLPEVDPTSAFERLDQPQLTKHIVSTFLSGGMDQGMTSSLFEGETFDGKDFNENNDKFYVSEYSGAGEVALEWRLLKGRTPKREGEKEKIDVGADECSVDLCDELLKCIEERDIDEPDFVINGHGERYSNMDQFLGFQIEYIPFPWEIEASNSLKNENSAFPRKKKKRGK